MKHPLGRIPSKFDARDYDLTQFIPTGIKKLTLLNSRSWAFRAKSLNQGDTNHCVGFCMADFGINLPVEDNYTNKDGHKFYYIVKEIEGEPLKEDGATMRGAAKALKKLGKINAYAFAPTIEVVRWWILNKGPMLAGTIWTEGMFEPDTNGVIKVIGEAVGGHAYLLNEWIKSEYIGIQNSWYEENGHPWGKNGKAYISVPDFKRLLSYNGEVIAAVELAIPPRKKFWFF